VCTRQGHTFTAPLHVSTIVGVRSGKFLSISTTVLRTGSKLPRAECMLSRMDAVICTAAISKPGFESKNKQYSDVAPPICAHACMPDSNRRHKRSKATFGNLMTSPKGVNSSKRHERSKATFGNLTTSPKGVHSNKRHKRSVKLPLAIS